VIYIATSATDFENLEKHYNCLWSEPFHKMPKQELSVAFDRRTCTSIIKPFM
jgi:hypothetical protein